MLCFQTVIKYHYTNVAEPGGRAVCGPVQIGAEYVAAAATSLSHVPRSPAGCMCVMSNCVVQKLQQWVGLGPSWAVAPQKIQTSKQLAPISFPIHKYVYNSSSSYQYFIPLVYSKSPISQHIMCNRDIKGLNLSQTAAIPPKTFVFLIPNTNCSFAEPEKTPRIFSFLVFTN